MHDADHPFSLIGDTQIGINSIALLSPRTGIGQYVFHLTHELQQLLPRQPWFFYGTGWSQEIRKAPISGIGGMKKTIQRFIPNPYWVTRFVLQKKFSSGVKRNKIQLYHEPNFLAYRYRGPTVVTVHDLSWVRYPEAHPSDRVKILNKLMPDIAQQANHLLVDSEFIRQEVMQHYGVAPERVSTVHLGVLPVYKKTSAPSCAHVMRQYGLRHGQYILAVGTLEPRKNIVTAIAAFSQLPEVVRRHYPLVIAGMYGWNMEGLTEQIRAMIGRKEVILTGYVAQEDLPLLYAGARMFVYPSLYEGFGLPPLEAMACGIPVIVSNRASLPEVVGNAGVMMEPLDDVALSLAMQNLIDDNILHQKLSVAGEERAKQFTWRKCALNTISVYQKVLQSL